MDIDAFVAYASPTSRSGKRPYMFGFHSFIGAACMDLWHHGEREPIEIIFDEPIQAADLIAWGGRRATDTKPH